MTTEREHIVAARVFLVGAAGHIEMALDNASGDRHQDLSDIQARFENTIALMSNLLDEIDGEIEQTLAEPKCLSRRLRPHLPSQGNINDR